MSDRYERYLTKPFQDIVRADQLLNGGQPSGDDVALAHALTALASVKMLGSGRA